MSVKRIRCECGRVYEPAKHPQCPACGAQTNVATIEPAKPSDAELVSPDDEKPVALSGRLIAIIAGAVVALLVLVVVLVRRNGSETHTTVMTPGPTATAIATAASGPTAAPTAVPTATAPPPAVTPPIGMPQPFDLAAAIASAVPGATIRVPPGSYPGGLVITRGIKLIASGGQAVIQAEGRECLSVRAPGVSVQGVMFVCNGIGELPAISVADGADLTLDGCRMQSGTALGVTLAGNAALTAIGTTFTTGNGIALRLQGGKANLTQSTIADSKIGVALLNGASLEAQSCAFERNGGSDSSGSIISASGQGTSITAADCHFTGNFSGIFALDGAIFSPTNSSFKENGFIGSNPAGLLHIKRGGRALVKGSTFSNNRQGIMIGERGGLEMEQCQMSGNGVQQARQMFLATMPVTIMGQGATATIRATSIVDSTQIAVSVLSGGSLVLDDVEISGARTGGLQVGDQGSPPAQAEIRRAKFNRNATGIGVFAGSRVTLEDSECRENNNAIVVGDAGSELQMRKTIVAGSRDHGLAVYADGRASVTGSEFRDNARGAQSGMPKRSAGKGFVSLEDCVIGGNRVFGVGAHAQSELILTRINFEGTDKTNIYKERGAIVQNEATPTPSPDASVSPAEEASPSPTPGRKTQKSSRPLQRTRRPEDDAARILRQIFRPR